MVTIVASEIMKYNWDGEFPISVVGSETKVKVTLRMRRPSILPAQMVMISTSVILEEVATDVAVCCLMKFSFII